MQTMSNSTPKRRVIPSAHAGAQTSNEPCAARGARTARGQEPRSVVDSRGDGRAGQEADDQDRTAGVQDHEDSGSVDETAGDVVPVAVSGDYAGSYA